MRRLHSELVTNVEEVAVPRIVLRQVSTHIPASNRSLGLIYNVEAVKEQ